MRRILAARTAPAEPAAVAIPTDHAVPAGHARTTGHASSASSASLALPRLAAGVGLAALAAVVALAACAPAAPRAPEPVPALPPVAREFRGVWVATVRNIDWPSSPGLPVAQQKAELLGILDRAAALNLNAVIFQVRPAADAFYRSGLEPWSVWLTGTSGQAPAPEWDPLEFAVAEAHKRGLQLHAWLNPFRARDPAVPSAPGDLVRAHPDLVLRYGSFWWMDPGDAAVRAHSLEVVRDVVRRYDVDGVHIDDYFYPYPENDSAGVAMPFPDDRSWAAYQAGGGTLSRDDWRRKNIDDFVEGMYREVKREKPWVQVGISPFGIWRPDNPPGTRGFDAFARIYADSRKWLENGWLDYFTPQLYWKVDQPGLGYAGILRWWVEHNPRHRNLWPGLFTGRIGNTGRGDWQPAEIEEQIRLTRVQPGATGNVHFSYKVFPANPSGISDRLLAGPYAEPALVPPSPWLGGTAPSAPKLDVARAADGGFALDVTPRGAPPALWVLRVQRGGAWSVRVLPGDLRRLPLPPASTTKAASSAPAADVATDAALDLVAVSGVDRLGNEGPVTVVRPGR